MAYRQIPVSYHCDDQSRIKPYHGAVLGTVRDNFVHRFVHAGRRYTMAYPKSFYHYVEKKMLLPYLKKAVVYVIAGGTGVQCHILYLLFCQCRADTYAYHKAYRLCSSSESHISCDLFQDVGFLGRARFSQQYAPRKAKLASK